ncbi:snRNA-activating protein complex subunit isoform X4 [Hevea brasiliensis]|uniref:snRNA-activating protein complex subunit isoform X4 n=1 Tax=Hevea brasiliensis TaxID=3981 RepID=UPI0025FD8C68|nr:snRNA-activating protein complex subunit isoform X4 [Hevea brasiliensis]
MFQRPIRPHPGGAGPAGGNGIVSHQEDMQVQRQNQNHTTNTQKIGAAEPCLVFTSDPKPRLRWTSDLHERFVDAVTPLGGANMFELSEDMNNNCRSYTKGHHADNERRTKLKMEMINSRDGDGDQETSVSIARGGPIYVPNLVGPLTRVPDFESALFYELEDLKDELCLHAISPSNDDNILIDKLKIYSDEDLVEMALKETLNKNESSLRPSSEGLIARFIVVYSRSDTSFLLMYACMRENDIRDSSNNTDLESSELGDPSATLESLNGETYCNGTIANKKSRKRQRLLKSSDGSRSGTSCNRTIINNNSRKGKGKKANKCDVGESCFAKVDEVLKIKQKQDQDKATVRLHSFNCKANKGAIPSSEPESGERLKMLLSTNSGKQQLKPSNVQEHIPVHHPEVLCIEVYHNIRHWLKTQELLVLGRQMLTEMRDRIYCMTDQVMQKAGHYDPSGYFLIEDVFCNDTRDPSAIDYSEPIFDWLTNSKDDALRKWECIISGELQRKQKAVIGEVTTSQLPQFRRVDMQKTRFCDLRFRLGAGYLYCHQGDCKHTIVIRDLRLIHPEDVQNRAAYPIVIFQLKLRFQKCNVCNIFRATKVTLDDKWTPDNPCYFCNDCYYLLHYSENGSLLYSDFSTYDYLHD